MICWLRSALLLTVGALLFPTDVCGQTLTDTLLREDPAKLVLAARESGDIVRGAILFHQGNINCAKCHRPIAEKDRIGPDLSRLDSDTSDESLVESILQPSKSIRKGYETVSIVTVDGKVRTGSIVEQNETVVVLRIREQIDQRTVIERKDIEILEPSRLSNMPDGLANQLKNRQQFLDLLRYVLDLRRRGPGVVHGQAAAPRREFETGLQGLVLIDRFNCQACHQSVDDDAWKFSASAPDLRWSVQHLNVSQLIRFLRDPHEIKPGTRMPDLLHQLDPQTAESTARAIVSYLMSTTGNPPQEDSISTHEAKPSTTSGFDLFHTVGCVACHAPRDREAVERPLADSVALGDVSSKYDLPALTSFLEDPHQVRPDGRMPNLQLRYGEARDLASYLLQPASTLKAVPAELSFEQSSDPEFIEQGRRWFQELQCANCHPHPENGRTVAATFPALQECDSQGGCLSEDDGAWPSYRLSDAEREQIRHGIAQLAEEATSQQRIDVQLVSLRCTACHERNQLGGVPSDRSHYFQTTNLNLGEQGRIPPTLTGVGAKLQPGWLRDVLVNRRSVRPYMKTRMPQFGEHNVAELIRLLPETDSLPPVEFASVDNQKETRKLGLELAGNRGLNCVACHTYQYKLSDTMPAVDLTEMAERLQKNWFYQYMRSPQTFVPNTVMPSFWPGGRAIRSDLPGTADDQIEALWQYLLDGRQAGAPRGVMREPLEILVTDRARMLRRSYPEMGKRGIGVGYPGGVNLAFDAEQLRLGLIWKGRFVDPGGVWYGQGHGRVRPLGSVLKFASGPDIDDLEQPWAVDDGRPPHHRFRGYSLDEAGRPAFRYEVGTVGVRDFFSEITNSSAEVVGLRRQIECSLVEDKDLQNKDEPPPRLRVRIATGQQIVQVTEREYRIGDRLRVLIHSPHEVQMTASATMLQIPFSVTANQNLPIVIDYLWD
ncbi:MAG: hypothetical protein Fues2KO_34350 [Fuerstiella sp.]